jgi:hypothetical protein
MSHNLHRDTEIDKEALITYVERPDERYCFYSGEAFRYEKLPVGTRVIYPPPPLDPIPDLDDAIENALENPMGCDPFSAQLRSDMKVTVAFDDISIPLPPMQTPDVRQRIIEKVLTKLAEHGVTDIHLVAALGLHRRMTQKELKRVLGSRIYNSFSHDHLYNHDAEDQENMVFIGQTSHGEEVVLPRRIIESDLLIYVNINIVSMDGGHKSINTGLVPYRTIRHHHNVDTLMKSTSYMDPPNSALHHSCDRMGAIVEEHLNVFKIETTLNTNTFPYFLNHLQKQERDWNLLDKATFGINSRAMKLMPYALRRSIFQAVKAPFGLTGIAAGRTDPVHEYTLSNVFRQQVVPVKGQADVMVMGMPYLGPYNVNSIMNPILVHCNALGYLFNLYRGKPLVRRGGVLIFMHPLENRFHKIHHAPYIEFYNRVLSETREPAEIERIYEKSFATNPKYIDMYRNSHAYHGVHPFYMWYWAAYGQAYLGRVIVVGVKDKTVADTLGYETAETVDIAFEMAKDTVGQSPEVTAFHLPPVFMVDVE